MECVELYRVWVAFGVGLFIGGVVGIVTMCILNAVRPIIRLTCEAYMARFLPSEATSKFCDNSNVRLKRLLAVFPFLLIFRI